MPLATCEVRWFFDGALDETGAGVEAWFKSRAPLGRGGRVGPLTWSPRPPLWRGDRYVVIPGARDMGVKWREGQVQLKGRTADPDSRKFAPGVKGTIESWVKWSYAGTAVDQRFAAWFASSPPGHVLVEKRRLQRQIQLGPRRAMVEIEADRPCPRACVVELARIRAYGSSQESHWTLGFEARPADTDLPEQLAAVVTRFLEGSPALPLTRDRSLSYPAWLARLDGMG